MSQDEYIIPDSESRVEHVVMHSRFLGVATAAGSVDEARSHLNRIRAERPAATHHPYAFRVGYGSTVVEGAGDDGEPSGTAGPPILAVLRGRDLGDVLVVVSRIFGGAKLGTGGLVRAYSETARQALASLHTRVKTCLVLVGVEIPYSDYQVIRTQITDLEGMIEDTAFGGQVTIYARIPKRNLNCLEHFVAEISRGQSTVIQIEP